MHLYRKIPPIKIKPSRKKRLCFMKILFLHLYVCGLLFLLPFCLFLFKGFEEHERERQCEEKRKEIRHRLTRLHAEQGKYFGQNQHERYIEQTLTGNGQQGCYCFIPNRLIGDPCHEIQRQQGHTQTLQLQRHLTDFLCLGSKIFLSTR